MQRRAKTALRQPGNLRNGCEDPRVVELDHLQGSEQP
jgi:hypothetical protein